THAMLSKLRLFTRVASLSLLLTPVKAWCVPERVEIVLGTETLASERQAVLVLSAVVGSNLCYASSDLKIATKFDAKSALIEILGYDFMAPQNAGPCPAAIRETRTKVSLPNTWLEPNTENRIVFALGRSKNQYIAKRDGFRVELIPEAATTVLTLRLPECLTSSPLPTATVLWPPNV